MTKTSHIHLDAVGGIAGDMFVAAMLDAIPSLQQRIFADLAAVLPPNCGTPRLNQTLTGGIAAKQFNLIEGAPLPTKRPHDHAHQAPPPSVHGLHHHHDHHHGSGTYGEMRQRIETAPLTDGTANHAAAILRALAEVESNIHGIALEQVHFHEISDWDSLMDVVAAASIIATLSDVTWSVSALPLGGGLVKTAHGLLPVPVPAATALLHGYTWRDDGIPGERVTPTGAAILCHITGGASGIHRGGTLITSGCGAGSRVLPGMPNILRASLFADEAQIGADVLCVLECEIDDMTGEEIAQASDKLRALAPIRDVTLIPGMGKKGRPLVTLRLLARPEDLDAVIREVLLETSTLGVRWHKAERHILTRTPYHGTLRAKHAQRPNGATTTKVESDELSDIATLAARRAAKSREENP
ncbi:MAG: LarC family nickel insertion protein [Rhodospirillaceae bacterium]|nr:LarC family nickel insertion protein [Rhodospirillaceae bacterium]